MEDKLSSAAELPYFEGDFWPNVLEESIKELDQEEEEKRKQAEAAEAAANAVSYNKLVSFFYTCPNKDWLLDGWPELNSSWTFSRPSLDLNHPILHLTNS